LNATDLMFVGVTATLRQLNKKKEREAIVIRELRRREITRRLTEIVKTN